MKEEDSKPIDSKQVTAMISLVVAEYICDQIQPEIDKMIEEIKKKGGVS